MRKLLLSLLAALVLSGGVAFAQQQGMWAGLSGGFPGASVHFGVENVVQNLDVRANLGYTYVLGTASFGVDALYGLDLDLDGAPVDVYVGGGVGAAFDGTFSVKALGGAEYRLVDVGVPELGVFFEVGPVLSFGNSDGFGADARLGVNYHF
ncbi:MAG: hypothetical protein U5K81_10925 [Trueperaceae bacterium]|nr:hypothetical protein [Trueperaceae bacterium]